MSRNLFCLSDYHKINKLRKQKRKRKGKGGKEEGKGKREGGREGKRKKKTIPAISMSDQGIFSHPGV